MRHTVSWLIWALCAAVLVLTLRNPLYITLVALSTWLVYLNVSRSAPMLGGWRGLLLVGFFIWLVTIPFNALMIHQGSIVLFELPRHWPLIGGPITLEAVLAGAVSGYALWMLLFIFATFNLAVDAAQLLRLAPRSLYHAGVVTSIALTFIPQMLKSAQEIREAQRIRGHRFRGWRDVMPLVIPLLTTAFERAVLLAESMEARGFGGELTGLTAHETGRLRMAMIAGLLSFLIGFVMRLLVRDSASATILIGAGAVGLVYSMIKLGQHVRRTRYKREEWQLSDSLITMTSLVAVGGMLWMRHQMPDSLAYAPHFADTLLPEFDLVLGILLALMATPGLLGLAYEGPAVQADCAASQKVTS